MRDGPPPQDLEGYVPGCDPLVYGIDVYSGEEDEFVARLLDGSGTPTKGDDNEVLYIKLCHGQKPESKNDKRTAARTYDACLRMATKWSARSKPYGVYHWPTIHRDGKKSFWDVIPELMWVMTCVARFYLDCVKHGIPFPSVRFLCDIEDHKDGIVVSAAHRTAWVHEYLYVLTDFFGYKPLMYMGAAYCKKYMLDRKGRYGKPNPVHHLGEYPLMQPHYKTNNPDRNLYSPELPPEFLYRVAHQFTSKYVVREDTGKWDRYVVRMSAIELTECQILSPKIKAMMGEV